MDKKLCRVKDGRIIAGVCGGVARYFDVDPTIVRALWIIFCACGGSGLLAYLIIALIMPEEQ